MIFVSSFQNDFKQIFRTEKSFSAAKYLLECLSIQCIPFFFLSFKERVFQSIATAVSKHLKRSNSCCRCVRCDSYDLGFNPSAILTESYFSFQRFNRLRCNMVATMGKYKHVDTDQYSFWSTQSTMQNTICCYPCRVPSSVCVSVWQNAFVQNAKAWYTYTSTQFSVISNVYRLTLNGFMMHKLLFYAYFHRIYRTFACRCRNRFFIFILIWQN